MTTRVTNGVTLVRCSVCDSTGEPELVQGQSKQPTTGHPQGWATLTISSTPICSRVVCPKCVAAVKAALNERRTHDE